MDCMSIKEAGPLGTKGTLKPATATPLARVEQSRVPYDWSAPIVAKEDGYSTPELIDNGSDI
jgi:hypothetical protein